MKTGRGGATCCSDFLFEIIRMLISQAFSHEVNSDPERFRDKFVDFDGKVDLVVLTDKKLYDPEFDWTGTIDGFAQKIDESTKSDVVRKLTVIMKNAFPKVIFMCKLAFLKVKCYFCAKYQELWMQMKFSLLSLSITENWLRRHWNSREVFIPG